MKPESRGILLCCRREEIQSAETNGFRVEDHPLDERAPQSSAPPLRVDGSRAEQSVIAALLESGDANELAVTLGYHVSAPRLPHTLQREVAARQ